MPQKHQTLGEFIIENQSSFKYTSGELSRLINSIRLAAKVVNYEVNKAGLVDILGTVGDTNVQGEDNKNWMCMPMKNLFKPWSIEILYVALQVKRKTALSRLIVPTRTIKISMLY